MGISATITIIGLNVCACIGIGHGGTAIGRAQRQRQKAVNSIMANIKEEKPDGSLCSAVSEAGVAGHAG